MPSAEQHRRQLLAVYSAALEAVDGRRAVREHLARHPPAPPVHLIAMGKAACRMARGAIDALGGGIADAFIVTKEGYGEPLPWPCRETGHPVPDARSLDAGAGLVDYVARLPAEARVLVLLSGGASSLVEHPLPGVGLAEVRAVNQWLLASGLDIMGTNRVRKRLSQIKGGRLAALLAPRPVVCLAISDVPGDDPVIIASGPLARDTGDVLGVPDDAPAFLRSLPPPPPPPAAAFDNVRMHIVANASRAGSAAAGAAERFGYRVERHGEFIVGDAAAAGRRLARQVLDAGAGRLHIWGGETTVRLPPSPGRGGRNQHLALAAAQVLQDAADVLFLAAATDGSDGPGEDAGALVDAGTIARARLHGFDADRALADADAGSLLEASGDLIATGPTGTNVMDIMLGLRW